VWRTRFGRVCGPFVRQSTERMTLLRPTTNLIRSVIVVEMKFYTFYLYGMIILATVDLYAARRTQRG
jgi:hypothetical protein